MNKKTIALSVGYLASIVAGVWAVSAIGIVSVGFGLMAPAAVYFVGVTLVFRDLIQEAGGKRLSIALIVVGAALSAIFSPAVAVASGAAFLVSELLDLFIYTKIRKRLGMLVGVVCSNAVSALVDSYIFLSIAFASLAFFPGQVVGKLVATVIAVALIPVARKIAR